MFGFICIGWLHLYWIFKKAFKIKFSLVIKFLKPSQDEAVEHSARRKKINKFKRSVRVFSNYIWKAVCALANQKPQAATEKTSPMMNCKWLQIGWLQNAISHTTCTKIWVDYIVIVECHIFLLSRWSYQWLVHLMLSKLVFQFCIYVCAHTGSCSGMDACACIFVGLFPIKPWSTSCPHSSGQQGRLTACSVYVHRQLIVSWQTHHDSKAITLHQE